jgi:hypothetical protein
LKKRPFEVFFLLFVLSLVLTTFSCVREVSFLCFAACAKFNFSKSQSIQKDSPEISISKNKEKLRVINLKRVAYYFHVLQLQVRSVYFYLQISTLSKQTNKQTNKQFVNQSFNQLTQIAKRKKFEVVKEKINNEVNLLFLEALFPNLFDSVGSFCSLTFEVVDAPSIFKDTQLIRIHSS